MFPPIVALNQSFLSSFMTEILKESLPNVNDSMRLTMDKSSWLWRVGMLYIQSQAILGYPYSIFNSHLSVCDLTALWPSHETFGCINRPLASTESKDVIRQHLTHRDSFFMVTHQLSPRHLKNALIHDFPLFCNYRNLMKLSCWLMQISPPNLHK